MRFSKRFFSLFLPLLIIVAIALAGFSRTIGSYFLEDDFGEILYVSQIFAGDWHKVIANFTGNYMEIPTMKVYRPVLLLSLLFDYAIWKTKAIGYFVTNIVFFIGAAMMLYLLLRQLTKSWSNRRSILFALFAAALFAASPLHCESISLMIGRVDIICAFFYLFALWGFVRKGESQNPSLFLLSLMSFWIALLTKEMAIGLPVVLMAIGLLLPENITKKDREMGIYAGEGLSENIIQRFQLALRMSLPAWISCFVYLLIRYLALGTFLGGYVGSIGASQFSHIFEKWSDPDTVSRIIFPFNMAVFGDHNIYQVWLGGFYIALILLAIIQIFMRGIPRAWLLLLMVWILTTLVPIYQLWGLGFNLEGGRFVFFLTIPLAIILPLLIFAPQKTESAEHYSFGIGAGQKVELPLLVSATLIFAGLIMLETRIAAKNNTSWIHAGKQTKALLKEGQKLAQSLAKGQKVIILGIPDQLEGAHVIYNGATFNFLMTPPFASDNFADRFITFLPILFGRGELINAQRFKQELQRPDVAGVYLWHRDKRSFEALNIPDYEEEIEGDKPFIMPLPSMQEIMRPFTRQRGFWQLDKNCIHVLHGEKGSGVVIGPIDLNPFTYDYLEITAAIDPAIDPKRLEIFWRGQHSAEDEQQLDNRVQGISCQSGLSASPDGSVVPEANISAKEGVYRIPLSQYWHWFAEGRLKYLWLEFPPTQSISLKDIRLVTGNHLVPKLSIVDLQADNTGVYSIGKKGFSVQIDASKVDNCDKVKLEFSKANYFFENLGNNAEYGLLTTMTISGCLAKNSINGELFPSSGYYQLRAIGLNKNGLTQGEWSYPLTIKFDSKVL